MTGDEARAAACRLTDRDLTAANVVAQRAIDYEDATLDAGGRHGTVTLHSYDATFGTELTVAIAGAPQHVPKYVAPRATYCVGITRRMAPDTMCRKMHPRWSQAIS
jgi:hypothetical protein